MKSRLLNFLFLSACLLIGIFVMDWICPMEAFIGIPCPGCGMTSALYHLLRGDLRSAWFFHPALFLLLPIAVIVLVAWIEDDQFLKTKTFRWLFVIGLCGYLLVYLYRMMTIFPSWPMQYVEGNVVQRIWSLIR